MDRGGGGSNDFFNDFFGFGRRHRRPRNHDDDDYEENPLNPNQHHHHHHDEETEIQRFLDNQMDFIFKSFFGSSGGFGANHGFYPPNDFGPPHSGGGGGGGGRRGENEENSAGSRDFMLNEENVGRKDVEIEGNEISPREWDKFKRQNFNRDDDDDLRRGRGGERGSRNEITPFSSFPFHGFFPGFPELGQNSGGGFQFNSVIERTEILPDGSRETTRTERSSDGTETTTVIKSEPGNEGNLPPPSLNPRDFFFGGRPPFERFDNPSQPPPPLLNEEMSESPYNRTGSIFEKFFGRKS